MLDEMFEDPAYSERVVYYFRHFPLTSTATYIGCQKHLASEAAHQMDLDSVGDAGVSESFWYMHDEIFELYSSTTEEDLFLFAADAGLDETEFTNLYEATETYDWVYADKAEGYSVGVSGTPTIFVNGVKVSPWSYVPDIVDCLLEEDKSYNPETDMDAGL